MKEGLASSDCVVYVCVNDMRVTEIQGASQKDRKIDRKEQLD
jgi:hypothetical protein